MAHLENGDNVLYVDEATCNPWDTVSLHTWMDPRQPIYKRKPYTKGKGLAL